MSEDNQSSDSLEEKGIEVQLDISTITSRTRSESYTDIVHVIQVVSWLAGVGGK